MNFKNLGILVNIFMVVGLPCSLYTIWNQSNIIEEQSLTIIKFTPMVQEHKIQNEADSSLAAKLTSSSFWYSWGGWLVTDEPFTEVNGTTTLPGKTVDCKKRLYALDSCNSRTVPLEDHDLVVFSTPTEWEKNFKECLVAGERLICKKIIHY
ncbi:MAG: hypothetical protein NTY12_04355 [Candidatus Falkowbacteria bacterium]|nr:hypothetical protein [Candidatus Falkowbacteria bacterium]